METSNDISTATDMATAMSQLDEFGYYVCRNLIDLEYISKLINESHSLYESHNQFTYHSTVYKMHVIRYIF
mgnify:CR=1 FL=1